MKSNSYLAFVKSLPCCNCRTSPCEPHHLIDIGMGIMGGKASDSAAVPLCRPCHDEVHKDAKSWPQTRWMIETQERAFIEGVLKL